MRTNQQRVDARSVLGPDHPLARVTTELSVAAERTVTVAVAAVAVLAALLARMAMLVAATNRRAIELIAQGRGDLPVAAVARARQRLLDPAQRESLARALDVIRAEASRPPSECHRIAPLTACRWCAPCHPSSAR